MEGKDRRGRKTRQDGKRLALDQREAERLARLERDAMHDHAAELCNHTVGKIAGTLRCPTGEDDQIAGVDSLAQRGCEGSLLIGKSAEGDRLATCLRNGGRDDGAVAVIDASRRERPSGCDELVAGREHRHLRLAEDLDTADAAGRKHADLTRGDGCVAPQDHLSARDVGAGIGNELAKRRGAAHVNGRIFVNEIGLLDHDDRVGAARNHAPGRDGGRPARLDVEDGSVPAHDDLAVEAKAARRDIARATGVG